MSRTSAEVVRDEALSALVDGQAMPDELDRVCRAWSQDSELRRQWHAYQLIGDVMRSDELAGDAARDRAFLSDLRARLANEPVVLAPAMSRAGDGDGRPAAKGGRWRYALAGLSGVAVVLGVLWVQGGGVTGLDPALQQITAGRGLPENTSASGPAGSTSDLNEQMIRDARLDEYLAAHKRLGGSSTAGGLSRVSNKVGGDGR